MLRTIKLCMKPQQDKEHNRTFPSYFGYKVDQDENGNWITREYPAVDAEGKSIMKAKSFKVALSDTFEAKLKADNSQFPYIVVIDDEAIGADGKKVTYNKVDKDKDGNVRLDKYGRRHAVMVIKEAVRFEPCPRQNIEFDDLEDFE